MNRAKIVFSISLFALVPSLAFAHPAASHVYSMVAGLSHPVTGFDHILAMLAVGIWAAQKGGRALWLWPSAFVGMMLLGGFLGLQGIALPLIEPVIAASILVLGLLIASLTMLPLWAGAALIGAFALFHGNAHGLEAPASSASLLYALGFALSTAGLHGIGALLVRTSSDVSWQKLMQTGGAITAGIGGILFFV